MLGMNTLRAKEPVQTAPDQWPAEIGKQMAAAHRIDTDPRLPELLKMAEELCEKSPSGRSG